MDLPVISQILEMHWDWSLPVNVEDIAKRLGMEVGSISPEDNDLSGLAEITSGGKRIIRRATHESFNRQRFTLAHEIGHHMLGHVTKEHKQCRDNFNNFSSEVHSSLEQQANNFAAQLLMPEEALRIMIFRKGVTDINELSNSFNVSGAAMYYRLKNLGLLSL
jgi:hypothetical protein